jgi:hypothetical protein
MKSRKSLEALTFIIGVPAIAGAIAGIIIGTNIIFFPRSAPPLGLADPWKILAWSVIMILLITSVYCLVRKIR